MKSLYLDNRNQNEKKNSTITGISIGLQNMMIDPNKLQNDSK